MNDRIMREGENPEMAQGMCGKESKRPRVEYLKQYEIRIRCLSRGCVIAVGCKEIPFTSIEEGMLAFNAYVVDPEGEIAKWHKLFNQDK
jgi:hypothetical protein